MRIKKEANAERVEKKGEYGVQYLPGGYIRITPETEKFRTIPPDSEILARYRTDMKTGKLSETVKTWISYRAVPSCGRRSLREGKEALGLPHTQAQPLDKIQDAIRQYWPFKSGEVSEVIEGKACPVKRLINFKGECRLAYGAATRREGGLLGVLKTMGPPYSTPEFFRAIRNRQPLSTINPATLGKQLYEWFCAGEGISSSDLKNSPHKLRYYRQLETLASNGLASSSLLEPGKKRGKRVSVSRVISQISGLALRDVTQGKERAKENSLLVEKYASFVFHWARALGISLGLEGVVYDSPDSLKFTINPGMFEGVADLRVGDTAVEVKAWTNKLDKPTIADIKRRYYPGKNMWDTGEVIDRSMVVLAQPEHTYSHALAPLRESGIEIMTYPAFLEISDRVVAALQKDSHLTDGLSPRANLNYLRRYSREILSPCLLMRDGNECRRRYTREVLESLIQRAKDISFEGYEKPVSQDSLDDLLDSQVVEYQEGEFLIARKDFEDVESGGVGKFIHKNREALFLRNLRKKFPELAHLPKPNMLFWDLETCGLSGRDPIIMVGAAEYRKGKSFDLTAMLARDYTEERAMLSYFLEMLNSHDIVFTYNGSSFDVPRLLERARQNGILTNGNGNLPEKLRAKHIDLYHLLRKRVRLPDAKLQTAEKNLFKFTRSHDLPGAKIPAAYHSFIKGEPPKKMKAIVEHNMLDVTTMFAILTYLCS